MFCAQCGKPIEASSRFCPSCGHKVNVGSSQTPLPTIPEAPRPIEQELTATDLPPARPWARFLARQIDLAVWGPLIVLIAVATFPRAGDYLSNPYQWAFVALPLAMLVDAIVMATTGTSLGKKLASVYVRRSGRRLTFVEALKRNLGVYFFGLGLGIPIVALVTMAFAAHRLRTGRRARWDENLDATVAGRPLNAWRWLMLFGTWIALYVGMGALAAVILPPILKREEARAVAGLFSEEALARMAAAINKTVPKKIDEDTRIDSVSSGPGRRLTYNYTLVNIQASELDASRIQSEVIPAIKSNSCSMKEIQWLVQNGVTVAYQYVDKHNRPAFQLQIVSGDCSP